MHPRRLWRCCAGLLSGMLLAAGGAGAAETSVTPDWKQVSVKPHGAERRLYAGASAKAMGRLFVNPNASADALAAAVDADGLTIDATAAPEAAFAKVGVRLDWIDAVKFPENRYRLAVRADGPPGAKADLYFEGTTVEGKHFYRKTAFVFRGGTQEIVARESLPTEMRELHVRLDLFARGPWRIRSVDFGPDPTDADKPRLTFHATFDDSLDADVAGGAPRPDRADGVAFVDGVKGRAVRLTKAANSALRYETAGNLALERGTIALWFKPEWEQILGRRDNDPKNWRALVGMDHPDPKLTNGVGAVWFWCWGDVLRGDTRDLDGNYRWAGKLVRPGEWQHLAFTWDHDARDTELYIDGQPVLSLRDSGSPFRAALRRYAPGREALRHFFVGGMGGREQADGAIDELRIYSAPLSRGEIARLAADPLLPAPAPVNRYPRAKDGWVDFPFRVEPPGARTSADAWRLEDAAGRILAQGKPGDAAEQAPRRHAADTPPGRYRVVVTTDGRERSDDFWVLAPGPNPWLAPGGGDARTTLVRTVVPDLAKADPETFTALGACRMGELGGRAYLEAGGRTNDRFALRLSLPDADSLYFIEWDYPDDKVRTAEVIAQSANAPDTEYELQIGHCAGGEYYNTGKFLTQRALYFPRHRDVALIFMTARPDAPAAVAEVRVHRIEGGLPAAAVDVPEAVDGWSRTVGVNYEDPAFVYGFGVEAGTPAGYAVAVDRLAAYMKFSGQNLFAYPIVWYHGMMGDRYMPRIHPPDFLEPVLSRFDADGLEFLASFNQHNAENLGRGSVSRAAIEDGSLHAGPFTIMSTGKPNPGGWHGTEPNFNILHPDVQREVLANIDRLLDVGAGHPSFKGINFHLTRHALLWLGDVNAGYNDYMIDAFARDTGVRVPVDRADPLRGKAYAEWLLANARDAWIDWRCRTLAAFYREIAQRLRARRPDLRLVLQCMSPIDQFHRDDRFARADFVETKLREGGIDPKHLADIPNLVVQATLYPADFRWRSGRAWDLPAPEVLERYKTIDLRPEAYWALRDARQPWVHMHDRYFESAVGSPRPRRPGSVPTPLTAPWLSEHPWRVSTLNPAGFHAMRHYVVPLRYQDLLGFTKGGYLIGTYGMEEYLVPFVRAFRALPAKRFADLDTGSETVKARRLEHGGATWFYVVNTADRPAAARIVVDGAPARDLVTGAPLASPARLELGPYELRSFRVPGAVAVAVSVE